MQGRRARPGNRRRPNIEDGDHRHRQQQEGNEGEAEIRQAQRSAALANLIRRAWPWPRPGVVQRWMRLRGVETRFNSIVEHGGDKTRTRWRERRGNMANPRFLGAKGWRLLPSHLKKELRTAANSGASRPPETSPHRRWLSARRGDGGTPAACNWRTPY